jgi:hypothetical protein
MINYIRNPYMALLLAGKVLAMVAVVHVYHLWLARTAHANPLFEQHALGSDAQVDHSDWQKILDSYLVKSDKSGHTLFRYNDVSDDDKASLEDYIDGLQEISPSVLNQDEQFAYWVNMYNAVTVNLIIDAYPIESIKDVGSVVNLGPWDDVVVEVDGQEMTLNNIEHGVLRPIFGENRVHYAVNCASLGCPNLQPTALTAENLEEQLELAAEDFINHSKGVSFHGNELTLSSIYDWFGSDFGGDEESVLEHITYYATPELEAKLDAFNGKIKYDYNWQLNDAAREE